MARGLKLTRRATRIFATEFLSSHHGSPTASPRFSLETLMPPRETEYMSSNIRRIAFVCIFVLCVSLLGFGWGDEGHMAINRAAAARIPASMPDFFRAGAERLVYNGPEPDRWRHKEEFAVKNSQEPDHFIDLERTEGIGEFPAGRYQFIQKMYEKRAKAIAAGDPHADDFLPERVGFQPYITMEVYDRLKIAFRDYRRLKAEGKDTSAVEQNAVFYAGWLGHYIADGANPMHTTVNYNGWVGPNPNGYTISKDTHWNFESNFVKANLTKLNVTPEIKAPQAYADPFHAYLKYLWQSNALVEKSYQLEKVGAFKDGGTPDGVAFLQSRFAAAAQVLADFWYTAWVESEKPVIDPYAPPKPVATPVSSAK